MIIFIMNVYLFQHGIKDETVSLGYKHSHYESQNFANRTERVELDLTRSKKK